MWLGTRGVFRLEDLDVPIAFRCAMVLSFYEISYSFVRNFSVFSKKKVLFFGFSLVVSQIFLTFVANL